MNFLTLDTDLNGISELEKTKIEQHRMRILLFSIITSIGVGIGTLFISKKIISPIENLENLMKNFAKNPKTPKEKFHTNFKELENLKLHFQKMTETIENTITLEKKLNHQLKDLERQRNEFTAMMSHELKTPLFPIKGYAQILKKENLSGNLNKLQSEAVNEIYESSKRLDKLIGDILTAQKIERGQLTFNKKFTKVNDILTDQVSKLKPILDEKRIQINISETSNKEIYTDSDRINEVFTNLITNSIDFIPEGDGQINIGAYFNENKAIFYVQDNGSGIPQNKLNNLFKKFYQIDSSAKRKHDGSGLGLAICKGIIEGLGGKIWVESIPRQKTSFYFSLPILTLVSQNELHRR
ncbi:MAG: HAMP domain-containing sensor histidine kinase [Nitrosopumilaceae archaeon]|nr:HAMP domain-containing sensor histidine kinase [Nitrosopumilaceae archaeon]